MNFTRRQALRFGGGVALVGVAGGLGLFASNPGGQTGTLLASQVPLPERFRQPLRLPNVAKMVDGRVELVQRAADVEILPGRRTRILGYDGTFPGPTIKARSGEQLEVRVRSELSVATVVHLHGGVTPPESDGYPTDLILPTAGLTRHQMPGKTTVGERTYTYPLRQPAATLWYHDHAMDFTGPNVYAGLAGFFVVGDAADDALPLPREDRDLPLVITDRAFDGDAQFRYPALSAAQEHAGVEEGYLGGVLGDVILVNGVPWPTHDVSTARYRLRLLNGSNARRYQLTLDPPPSGKAFTRIGSDVGLLDKPVAVDDITLAPAERAEVIVDFSGYPVGTQVTVRNGFGGDSTAEVMRFVVARSAKDDTNIPEKLATIEPLDRAQATTTRDFHFQLNRAPANDPHTGPHSPAHRWTINGQSFAVDRDVATPRLGDVEVWRFLTDVHHPVHVHLAHFQVLSRNNRTPPPKDLGMKDTVDLLPGEAVEVITRFSGFRGRYVMHCHNLEHEDMAMMANFTVT
ncbi:Multicopper oxidase [Alloactinosynnema sp. L-07]|uniref:multicopper oxidase family protein n=1 Tax=Alloactinosynnema sp. L-07 TaxID=1653480 RepID=UPI00065F0454|nr:multicopper oxidase domain-containing protein [Alloactinosynnema sp. L-07]CRK57154.1 Multicopper oxidase [Alloactinosynnema sp. L-07]